MRNRHIQRMQRRAQLLGPDGQPIQSNYEIPFIRIYPSGERVLQAIDRGETLYLLACKFIAHGGRFGAYILADGSVDVVALMKGPDGDEVAVAKETSTNDARLLDAVDRIVTAAATMDVTPTVQ